MVRFCNPSSFGLDLQGAWRRSTYHGNHNSWHGAERPGSMVPGQKKDIGVDEDFVIAKTNFLLAVCRGFACNLPADLRHTFVREVCKWAGESLPDSNNPLDLQLSDLLQEVTDHLARADRALSAPHYNDIILVGRSGEGRRSLVFLITHMQRSTDQFDLMLRGCNTGQHWSKN